MVAEGGLKVKERINVNTNRETPLVSIVTVVLNGQKYIEKTIESVLSQTYNHTEYIIIDGGSDDGTLEVIRKYDDKISYWVSEPDNGLFDAMNKAIDVATGDYLWFLNAGDIIYSDHTLFDIFRSKRDADVYYGQTLIIDKEDKIIGLRRLKPPDKLSWKSFRFGMLVCHQAILVSSALVTHYNLNYKYTSDYEWVLKILKKSKAIINTKLILAKYRNGGLSNMVIKSSLIERFKIMSRYYGLIPTLFNHIVITARFIWFYIRFCRY